jgi:hypothetical protein
MSLQQGANPTAAKAAAVGYKRQRNLVDRVGLVLIE